VKRISAALLVAVLAAAGLTVAGLGVGPAAATGTDVCALISKSDASKLLGAKVVKTTTKSSASTGAQECNYKTKKYTTKTFKKFHAPLELSITWQPLTDEVRKYIADVNSDLTPITGIGDAAYADKFGTTFAVRGQDVVQAKVQNIESSHLQEWSQKGVVLALAGLPTG
jgi:hypothetical protein